MNSEQLRDLYHAQEPLIGGAAERLLPAVRARSRRRKIRTAIGYGATALATVAVVVGVTGTVNRPAGPTPVVAPHLVAPPAGMRVESSLGLQIEVPATWAVNDTGCHETGGPSVNRGAGPAPMCFTWTPPRKEFATIQPASQPLFIDNVISADSLPATSGTVDGTAVRRASGPIPGGMYAGWLTAPGRDVAVVVRARTAATVDAILGSVRLRDVDANGCGVLPLDFRPTFTGGTFVDPHPASVTVCYYGAFAGPGQSRLQSGAVRTGDRADELAAALNSTPPGRNPDQPSSACLRSAFPAHVDAVIVVYSADGAIGRVAMTWQVCTGVGMDDGHAHRQITKDLLHAVMDGLGDGYVTFFN